MVIGAKSSDQYTVLSKEMSQKLSPFHLLLVSRTQNVHLGVFLGPKLYKFIFWPISEAENFNFSSSEIADIVKAQNMIFKMVNSWYFRKKKSLDLVHYIDYYA